MGQAQFIKIDESDNIAVALCDLAAGECVQTGEESIFLQGAVPAAHKFSLRPLSQGQTVIKYGYPIGKTTQEIPTGSWVHTHNLNTMLEGKIEYTYKQAGAKERGLPSDVPGTFMGYMRSDGSVGVRNEIWVIPTVACANSTALRIAQMANAQFGGKCGGIFAFPHNAGCSQLGEDHITSQEILAGLVNHPNASGVLLLSLGCENNNLNEFLPILGDYDTQRIRTLIMQDVNDEYEKGISILKELSDIAQDCQRQSVPASKLRLGFKCGGSDAFSGITANPLCGKVTDILTAFGGTGILTEVPEMFGAEEILMSRADSKGTYEKVVEMINSFKQYFIDYGQPIYENPSPGNRKGGITTNEEKSLGCVLKGGHAKVTDVLEMGQQVSCPGLNLMNGPGNDNVSITNFVSSGAQMILFTTGNGNPLGTAVPCIKISSNTALYKRKPKWIDFNAGELLDGVCMEELAKDLWRQVLNTASGMTQAKNEVYGQRDIMIFKNGVTL